MTTMNIPAGYATLTGVMVLLSILALLRAGWARTVPAILAALGFCTLASIFVIDVITDGVVMNISLALLLLATALLLMLPQGFRVWRSLRKARPNRTVNPPDPSRRPAVG